MGLFYFSSDIHDGTKASGVADENVTYYEKKEVLGVDIRGNIYGGGNNAKVTGVCARCMCVRAYFIL